MSNPLADLSYSETFYSNVAATAESSAKIIAPLVVELVNPSSILDIGCGTGAWLAQFANLGVPKLLGLDAEYVNLSQLLIEREQFEYLDLSKSFKTPNGFDLVLCLEVAEHLPQQMGPSLIEQLTSSAPLVLFSAALPGQGGTAHINEQWHTYWHKLFLAHGFEKIDCIRPLVMQDSRVAWWYRQNIYLYASEPSSQLRGLSQQDNKGNIVPIAEHVLDQLTSFRGLFSATRAAAVRALKNRLLSRKR